MLVASLWAIGAVLQGRITITQALMVESAALATEDLAEGSLGQLVSLALVAVPSVWLVGAFWKDRLQPRTAPPAQVRQEQPG